MKFLYLLPFVLLPLFSLAQTEAETGIIDRAKADVKLHKFETAYELLDSFDPHNGMPDIVLFKEEIALNYYVASVDHTMFSFKDIGKNESILDYRGKAGQSNMHMLPLDKILDSLLIIHPHDYRLYKALGDYYYDIHVRYGNDWMIKDSILVDKIEVDYVEAIRHGLADYQVFYRTGLVFTTDGRYEEGIMCLRKATEMDSTDPDAHYNLAFAFLNSSQPDSALKHSTIAVRQYRDSSEKADAARMTGVLYGEKNNPEKAIAYMELSDRVEPKNYNTLKILLDMYLKIGEKKKARAATGRFYNLDTQNPTIYNDLVGIYTENNDKQALISFFKEMLKTPNYKPIQFGSLYFYLGRLYMDSDKNRAKAYLLRAKKILLTAYSPDNEVFGLIDQALKQIDEPAKK